MTGAAAAPTEAAAVVIHDLDQARRALAAAERTGRPVRLVSAPGAGAYMGPALFRAIVDRARAAHPAARSTNCLDCADQPGTALAALREGLDAVVLEADAKVAARVADAARRSGARLERRPARALDMTDAPADARLDAWLVKGTDNG